MATKSILKAQTYLEKKINWVLQTYLGQTLTQYNTDENLTGAEALVLPVKYHVGADMAPLAGLSNNPFDELPAIIVKQTSSTTSAESISGDRDVTITYEISCLMIADLGDIDWAVRQSKHLALAAQEVLEGRLPDRAGDSDGCVVWDTRLLDTAGTYTIPVQNQAMHWIASTVNMEVRIRANFQYQPTFSPIDLPQTPWFVYNFTPPNVFVQTDLSASLGTAVPNQATAISTHPYTISGSSGMVLTSSLFPDASAVWVVNQTQGQRYTSTINSGSVLIPSSSIWANNGDSWTVTAVNNTTATPCAYLINWTVEPNTWSSDLTGQAGIAAARAEAGADLTPGDIIIVDASGAAEEFFVIQATDDSLHVVPRVVPGGLSTSAITKRRGFRSEVPPTAGSATFVDWTSTEQGTGTVTLSGSQVVLTSIDTGNNRAYIQCDGNQTKGNIPMLIIEGLTAIGDDAASFGEAIVGLYALGAPYETMRCIDDAWVIGSTGGDVPAGGDPLTPTDLELILNGPGGVSWYRWGREGSWSSHTIDQNLNINYGASLTVSRLDGTTAESTLTSAILLNL